MALSAPKPVPALWWQGTLNTESEEVIELNELFSFYRHPQRYFMQRQMGIHFHGIEAEAEEREPFAISKLDGYSIYHEWIQETLNGKTISVKKLQAQGQMVVRRLGELEFDRQQEEIHTSLSNALRPKIRASRWKI